MLGSHNKWLQHARLGNSAAPIHQSNRNSHFYHYSESKYPQSVAFYKIINLNRACAYDMQTTQAGKRITR